MAGNIIWRGPIDRQPRSVNLPVSGALLPGTWVTQSATQLTQIVLGAGAKPLILGTLDFKDQDALTAYTSGDTGVAFEVSPNDLFQCALAAATYTYGQELMVGASGRLLAALSTNLVVGFFADTPGAYSAGALADVFISHFYTKP